MARKEIIFLSTLVLVLLAGVAAGRLWGRWAEAEMDHHDHSSSPKALSGERTSWLADQLNLSADQRQKMDAIWSDTRQKMDKMGEARRALAVDRDKSVEALLNPEQRQAYDKIFSDFRDRREQLDKDRQTLIDDASQRSKLLLDDNQKKQWDVLTRRMHEHRSTTASSPNDVATTQNSAVQNSNNQNSDLQNPAVQNSATQNSANEAAGGTADSNTK